jgi:hypothetical protein
MKNLLGLFALLLAFNNHAAKTEHESIDSIITTFENSIREKNKSEFLNLFLDPTAPMIAVVSEFNMPYRRAAVEKYNKEHNKNLALTRSFQMTPEKLIDMSLKRDAISREELSNIIVNTDGNIASVYFNYVYYVGDRKNNWGEESWQLVQTMSGWKISSVIYSVTNPVK